MADTPHPDTAAPAIHCAVITVSDTRTVETDRSGQLIQQLLHDAGHHVIAYTIVKDEPAQIRVELKQLSQQADLAAVIVNGGTGIAPRDTTYDAIATLLEKTLPGFGELFRSLSYQEIGSRAIASRGDRGCFWQQTRFFGTWFYSSGEASDAGANFARTEASRQSA